MTFFAVTFFAVTFFKAEAPSAGASAGEAAATFRPVALAAGGFAPATFLAGTAFGSGLPADEGTSMPATKAAFAGAFGFATSFLVTGLRADSAAGTGAVDFRAPRFAGGVSGTATWTAATSGALRVPRPEGFAAAFVARALDGFALDASAAAAPDGAAAVPPTPADGDPTSASSMPRRAASKAFTMKLRVSPRRTTSLALRGVGSASPDSGT